MPDDLRIKLAKSKVGQAQAVVIRSGTYFDSAEKLELMVPAMPSVPPVILAKSAAQDGDAAEEDVQIADCTSEEMGQVRNLTEGYEIPVWRTDGGNERTKSIGYLAEREKPHPSFPWTYYAWRKFHRDERDGKLPPPSRFPVVVRSDTYLDSPQKVQELLGLSNLPEVVIVKGAREPLDRLDKADEEYGDVPIVDCLGEEEYRICEATVGEDTLVWFHDERNGRIKRTAWIAHRLRNETDPPHWGLSGGAMT